MWQTQNGSNVDLRSTPIRTNPHLSTLVYVFVCVCVCLCVLVKGAKSLTREETTCVEYCVNVKARCSHKCRRGNQMLPNVRIWRLDVPTFHMYRSGGRVCVCERCEKSNKGRDHMCGALCECKGQMFPQVQTWKPDVAKCADAEARCSHVPTCAEVETRCVFGMCGRVDAFTLEPK